MKQKEDIQIPVHHFDGKRLPFDIARLNMVTMKNYESARQPHRHNYYEVFIFYKGGGTHYIDFNAHEIEDNSLHFISPGQVHLIRRAKGCHGFVITFPEELYFGPERHTLNQVSLYHNYTDTAIINCSAGDMKLFKQIIEVLVKECNKPELMTEELLRAYLDILLVNSNRIFLAKKSTRKTAKQGVAGNLLVQKFRQMVDEQFMKLQEVNEYAQQLAVTANHLNDVVKKTTGFTASSHIHNRILLEAKRLLFNTNHSVKEICFMLNFEDPTYFGRFFRKHVGLTPGDFRTEIRKKHHE